MAGGTRIAELTSIISSNTSKIEKYIQDNGLPAPSFDVDAPNNLGIPPEATDVEKARRAALEATAELQDLLTSSSALLRPNVRFSPKF